MSPGARVRVDVAREIKRVLRLEARTLEQVERAVDGAYAKAIGALAACRGNVLVTGVGKSGLIAQKIAATLSSTGTPAVALDPTEALHGGLGVVRRGDVVLAIGKSGESDELNALLPPLRSLGVAVIAITANPKSTLAKAARITLLTPVDREACPLNLAPTCSTTAALAVGDALAVTLMKVRGFRKEHFARNHPGGRLGRRLTLAVRDIMRGGEDHPFIRMGATMKQALLEITRQRAGAVNVVDARGKLVGLLTDYDVRKVLAAGKNPMDMQVREVMNENPTAVDVDALAVEASEIMEDRRNPFNVLPVVDRRGRAVGLVQIHDLRARAL